MDLRDFVRRERILDSATLTQEAWEALEGAIDAGRTPTEASEDLPPELAKVPGSAIRGALAAWRRYRLWCDAREAMVTRRRSAGRRALPGAVINAAASCERLLALEVAADLLSRGRFPDDEEWSAALLGAVDLWDRALSLARRDGSVRTELDEANETAADFADLAGAEQGLDELPPHRWLAIRRGERLGALTVEFSFPLDAVRAQLDVVRESIAPALSSDSGEDDDGSLSDDALLAALVLERLPGGLRRELDAEADRHAIGTAAESYADLLGAAPLSADRVAGLYVGAMKRPIGLAAIDRDGRVRSTARIVPTAGWTGRVIAWLSSEEVTHVVLPTQAPARAYLATLRQELAPTFAVVGVRPAGLAQARDAFLERRKRILPDAAAAAVLARRAVMPAREWAQVDPLRLGLAEYQADLDADTLAAELAVTRELVLRTLPSQPPPRRSGRRRLAAPAGKHSNPLLRSMGDLRPGMSVAGVVTNVTRFGAFVDMGLPQQGLIHVSDLADHFVRDPGEVVRIGQQVQAHVVNVDVSRGRISLSLRTPGRLGSGPPRRSGAGGSLPNGGVGSSGPGASGPGRRGGGGSGRTKALRDLDKLFDR